MKVIARWIKTEYRDGDKIEAVELNEQTVYSTPNSSSGVILDADKNIITGKWIADAVRLAIIDKDKTVTITDEHSASSYGQPVVLQDDVLTDLHQFIKSQ